MEAGHTAQALVGLASAAGREKSSTGVTDTPLLCELSHGAGRQNSILITHPHRSGARCSCSGAGSEGHVSS